MQPLKPQPTSPPAVHANPRPGWRVIFTVKVGVAEQGFDMKCVCGKWAEAEQVRSREDASDLAEQ